MKTLTIRFAAPLQSYGNEASFNYRTTNPYPTKSAVIGMVAAALGYQRTDQRILQLNELSFAVRIDQVGSILTDYQVVEWKANSRKVTYRDYIQDAVFMVALGSEDVTLIETIEQALHQPRFPLFFGRRSNPPAGVLKTQQFSDMQPVAVLKIVDWRASSWYQRKAECQKKTPILDIIADANLIPDGDSTIVKDNVGSFDQRNRYHKFRAIARTTVKSADLNVSTDHDIMGAI
ncbi:type I-E CRISPR-associated protein Cas5/CasD [Lactiplantibacillus daowaiensis]|uniref:Type I-E CRISPR-associated protein Cas5/CasD n=1 Tax=Lactiplantibacillus daowaiensis TaxID=2559918 RepID=A0ABW1RZ40_9LACO|nr:type I-E CRISPR-associated protein Cas5/CasD [Lactiplantibacillus daowaiensis]